MTFLLAFSSLAIGTLIGATGVGGVLLIPALMYFGGLETHQAMATALFSFFFAGILATYRYQKYGSIEWSITLPVLVGSFVSSYGGALVGSMASPRQLTMILAAIIILSSLYSLFPSQKAVVTLKNDRRSSIFLLLGIGLFTGFLCGMTGAGGGIVSVPVMLLFGYGTLPTIATSQVLQSVISVSGSASNISSGFVVFSMVWWVTACELAGIAMGVHLAHRVPVTVLKKITTLFCIGIGLFMAGNAFFH